MLASTMQFSTFGRANPITAACLLSEVVRRGDSLEETFPFPQDPTACQSDQLQVVTFHSGKPVVLATTSSWPLHVNVPPMS